MTFPTSHFKKGNKMIKSILLDIIGRLFLCVSFVLLGILCLFVPNCVMGRVKFDVEKK